MRKLFGFILLISIAQKASALQAAKDKDYHDISTLIGKAKGAHDELKVLNQALIDAKNERRKSAIRVEIARLKTIEKTSAEKAIWLTMRAYDIIPFADNFPIFDKGESVLPSPEYGKKLTWLPIFDTEGPKVKQRADGTLIKEPYLVGPKHEGNTASDGISRIFPTAFSSPAMLASIIIHEQHHFKQNTTDGLSNRKTTAELEVEAYELELSLVETLGFPDEIKLQQIDRINWILDVGDSEQPAKRKLAVEERKAANARGFLLKEPSLESHTEAKIASLIEQAKGQIVIAQREHDKWVNNQYRILARRSCNLPGSITQAEVDALPKLHKKELVDADYLDLRSCEERVYLLLYTGESVDKIENWSRYVVPAKPVPAPIIVPTPIAEHPARPAPPDGYAPVDAAERHFSSALLRIRQYARAACATTDMVPMEDDLIHPPTPYKFSPEEDAHRAAALGSDLDKTCELPLFQLLADSIRTGQTDQINAEWVQLAAARFRSPPVYRQPYSDPCPPGHGNGYCP